MRKTILLSITLFLFSFSSVFAQESILPGISRSTDVAGLVSGLINIVIAVGILLAVIMLSIGGFQYMVQDAGSSKEAAKKTMTQAVLGVIILLGAYLILFIINPQILNIKFLEGSSKDSTQVTSTGSGESESSSSPGIEDLKPHTIIEDLQSSGIFWYDHNCDPIKTREFQKNNPDVETGIKDISKPGECKPLSIRDHFVKKDKLREEGKYKCSYTITCVRK